MEINNITAWFGKGGDAIFLERYGDFASYEHDMDICVDNTQLDKVRQILSQEKDFQWQEVRNREGLYIMLDSKPYQRDGEPPIVDVFACSLLIDPLATLQQKKSSEMPRERRVLEKKKYCNGFFFNFVADRREEIERWHGKSWMTPQYDHHKWLCTLFLDDF